MQRLDPANAAGVLAALATVCRSPLHVGFRCPGLRTYVTGFRAGVHQQGDKARVVQHQPREVMAKTIPPSAATLEAIDDAHRLMLCGTGQLDSLVYWLTLDVELDVLEPPVLKERLCRASERVGRSLAPGGV